MRNLIFGINISLDGCCDHTKMTGNEEIHEYFTDLLRDTDILVYGRKTYQLMVPYWPDIAKNHSASTKAANEFARAFEAVNKIIVISKSLEKADGNKTSIVHSNFLDEIIKLKQEPGKNILTGGVDIPEQLIQSGLVDEYHIVIQPIIVGEGRRLLEGVSLQERLHLKLVDSKVLSSGDIALRYLKS